MDRSRREATSSRKERSSPIADPLFANPRLAEIYDLLDGPREDLDLYFRLARELGAQSVLDLGCGTGTFACGLADRGFEVIGVDPAVASLAVARRKPAAGKVRWICGDLRSVSDVGVDLVSMTGNVAQIFVDDTDWRRALTGVRRVLTGRGHLIFEARDPARRDWENWNRGATFSRVEIPTEIPGSGAVESWVELLEVDLPRVSFRWTYVFESDGVVLTSDSTLRFREREEIEAALVETGFRVLRVLDAPDRTGKEFVFVAA